jgi:hypothetical protein
MSAIPPNPLASAIQAHGAQARELAQQHAEASEQAARNSGFQERLTDAITNVERDNAVHADAEGAGSQGRAFSQPQEEDEESGEESGQEPKGASRDRSQAAPGKQVDLRA